MVETAIFSQWIHQYWFTPWYARWTSGRSQGEVDMVGLTTIDKEGTIEKNGITLNFVPSSIYAYVVGVNTLEIRSKL